MKKIIIILVLVVGIFGVFYFWKKEKASVMSTVGQNNQPFDLCFAKFGTPNAKGFADAYTLKMTIAGSKVSGDLKFLPVEKDSKVGTFDGTVSGSDQAAMSRSVDVMWATVAEGMNTTEQLKIIFNNSSAKVGLGEMIDRGDGTYVYKDPNSIGYSLELASTDCLYLLIHNNVESYLRKNIGILSPVKAALGGSWYVISVATDLEKASGIVVYEDGHIQEKKNFTYTVNEKQEVASLKIK